MSEPRRLALSGSSPAPIAERRPWIAASGVLPVPRQLERGATEPAETPVRLPWKAILVITWAAGAATVLISAAAGMWRVRQIVRRATPVQDPAWLALASEIAGRIGLRRGFRLYHTPELGVALTAGTWSPVVLLPEDAGTWRDEQRRIVLLHELAHVKRADCLGLVVSALATALYWFHPLAWFVAGRIRREGEEAADDLVLQAGTRASDYASELLAFVRSLNARSQALPAMALAESSHLEGRLRAILDPRRRRRAPSALAAGLCVATVLGFAATVAAVEPWAAPDAVARRPKVLSVSTGDYPYVNGKGIVFAGKRSPRSGSDWYSRGMSLHEHERFDDAIAAFQKAIELGYREDAASYNIACGYALKGDADRAFEWLKKSIEEGFNAASYLSSDDDLESLRSDPRMRELKKSLRANGSDRRRGEAPRLVARFERLMANTPKDGSNHDGLYDVGSDLLKAGEYEKAARAFQASAERGYKVSASLYNTACALSLKGDKGPALDYLQKSLEAGYDDPHHMDKDDDLDDIRDEPRFAELRKMADELTLSTDDKDFGGIGRWMGKSKMRLRSSWREASERYQRYLGKHPSSGRAYFNLGYVTLQMDDAKASRDAFQKAHDLGYRKPTTMYNLACANARLDQKDAAFEWLFKALDAGFEANGLLRNDDDLDNLRGDPRFKKARRIADEREHNDDDD